MNKTSKNILIFSITIFALCIVLLAARLSSRTTRFALGINGEGFIPLNKNALLAGVQDNSNPYMYFKFTQNQKAHLENARFQNGSAAVQVLLEASDSQKTSAQDFEFGFLYKDDFSSETELNPALKARNCVRGNFSSLSSNKVRLLLSIQKDASVPEGFYVFANAIYALKEVKFTNAKIGWSKFSIGEDGSEEEIPLFAFGPSGGIADPAFSSIDFSSAPLVFPLQNSLQEVFPKIEFYFDSLTDGGTSENPVTLSVKAGNENLEVIRAKNLRRMVVQAASLWKPYSTFEFSKNKEHILSVFMSANQDSLLPSSGGYPLKGLPTDLGLIADWPKYNWRCADFELYEWAEFPGILLFDFASYQIQDQFFTRLAYFVEKEGFKGTFVDDDFILNNHGYNAHDYGAKGLAEFFNQAQIQNVNLNKSELMLKEILLANSIILQNQDGSFKEGEGAVVSISRSSSAELRKKFLAHECWHGIYFTNENFRTVISNCRKNFNPASLEFLELYWANNPNLRYDRSDSFLMHNEFMAYMLQQNPQEAKPYFTSWADAYFLPASAAPLCAYVKKTGAQDFVEMCSALNEFAFSSWGLGAGRVALILR